MCVCVCVCVYTCTYVCVYVCMHVCVRGLSSPARDWTWAVAVTAWTLPCMRSLACRHRGPGRRPPLPLCTPLPTHLGQSRLVTVALSSWEVMEVE